MTTEVHPPTAILPQSTRHFLLRTPLITLAVYCLVSITVRENFPFSHFPMYSNPSAERMYYTISGEDGIGLPVAELTNITSPKIGKIYRTKAEKLAKKLGIKASGLTEADKTAIGQDILGDLRARAVHLGNGNKLPAKLQLNRIWISYKDGRIVEIPGIVAKE